MTWKTMESAPMGEYKTVAAGKKGTKEIFVPAWCFVWKEGMPVTQSYYIADSKRWNGFTKDHPPTQWHPFPEAPQ